MYMVSQKKLIVHSTFLSIYHDPIGVYKCATAPNKQDWHDWCVYVTNMIDE